MPTNLQLSGSFYHNNKPLFEQLRLPLSSGQWTCLLGPSGIGKSTLLRLFAGLSTGGRFEGDLSTVSSQPCVSQIAYMAQSDLLFPWLNLRENVMLGQRLRQQKPDPARADKLIDRVGLTEHANKKPHELSGGMRQRTALARTLMENKPVVMLDEPFSALDARNRADMQILAFDVLVGKTVLLVTHDPAEAVRLAHRLFVMDERGLHEHAVPDSEPARALDDKNSFAVQTQLLQTLQS